MASSDPFSATEEAPMVAASATTFANPSSHADALTNAKAEWTPCSALVSVNVPVGGEAKISADTINTALLATIGRDADKSVVSTRAYTVVGEQSCNPTGARVGINVSGTAKTAAHVDADGHQMFSAVIASRYHPVGEQVMPHISCGADNEVRLAERAAVAQKWAGVKPDNLLVGVQKMQSNEEGAICSRYAIPLAVATGAPAEDGEVTFAQQPLAWIAERNMAAFGDKMKVAQMPDFKTGAMIDHFVVGEEVMQDLVGATHSAVWGDQAVQDLVVSAEALGPVTGDSTVNIGLRVDADVLNFVANE